MAKIRRVVRRVRSPGPQGFDEQLWPVDVALIVLGAFLLGVDLAYLKFNDPRWYANATTWLILTPLLVFGTMATLRFVSNRVVRRGMQLAMVISVGIHLLFLVSMVNVVLFTRVWPETADTRDVQRQREPKVIPDYHPVYSNPQQKSRPDFEKPIETETPQVETEQAVEKQQEQETPQTVQPQPTPVPETQPTRQPAVVKRQETSEAVPRNSEQRSQLSRQQVQVQPRMNQSVAVPQASSSASAASATPQASQVARQSTAGAVQRRTSDEVPQAEAQQQQVQLARRQAEVQPQADSTATPTMPRRQATPRLTPRTDAQAAETSALARRTNPSELTPRNTEATRQETASPQTAQRASEPVPETPSRESSQPQRRQLDASSTPRVAQTPVPLPSRRARTTPRPDPTPASPTVAQTPAVARQAEPSPSRAAPRRLEAADTSTQQRPTTANSVAQPRPLTPEPQPAGNPTVAATNRRSESAQDAPQVPATPPAPSVARSRSQPTATASSRAVRPEPTASVTRQSSTEELAPSSTATIKQSQPREQVARAVAEPTPATSRRTPTSAPARSARRASGQSSQPSVVQAADTPVQRTSPSAQVASTAVSAENVATTTAPTQADAPQPSRDASQVARRPSQSAEPSQSSRSLETASLSPSTQAAAATAMRRAEASDVPTLDPQSAPSPQPSRSVRSAAVAASPVAVESPAVAQSPQPSGGPSVQPAQTVLNRSRTGIAGIGEARNLDRAQPAADSPAQVASGSARRRQASQQAAEGPALSPSQPALVSRSRADAARPSATLRAEAVPLATAAGADRPTTLNATASAAVTEAASNAESAAVTGSAGTVDVDLGPTRVVSEAGVGRASGGGQPELNASNEPPQLARSGSGTRTQATLAASQVAAIAAAPAGTGGGQPAPTEIDPAATAATRTEAGGQSPVTGGPSRTQEVGPTAEPSTAELVGGIQLKRADAAAAEGGEAAEATAMPDLEDEEEKARRLARSATGGGPRLALSAPIVSDVPSAAGAAAADASDPPTLAAADTGGQGRTAMTNREAAGGGPAGATNPDPAEPAQSGPAAGGASDPAAEQLASSATGGGLVAGRELRRAEAVDAPPGDPVPGGGSASPTRAAVGPQFTADSRAEIVTVAGGPQSGGDPAGQPLTAQGLESSRLAGGTRAPTGADPVGAAAGPATLDVAAAGTPGDAPGTRRAAPQADEDGPSFGEVGPLGAPLARAQRNSLPGGGLTVAQVVIPQTPGTAGGTAADMSDMGKLAGGMGAAGPMSRQETGGLAVNVDALEGPGGLGAEFTPDVGLNTRRSRDDSLQVLGTNARFARQQLGGTPDFNTAAIVAAEPFQGRMAKRPGDASGGAAAGGGPETEEAIERGLAFLARYQQADGSWTLKGFGEEVALTSDTAATGLSLLAFQGAGYTHREYRYANVVRGGLEFLLRNQQQDGNLYEVLENDTNRAVWLYSHAIAAIALCEAYGMTQDPELREPAQKALDFIVASQHKDRGGWRYSPNYGSDTSVTGWMMMALKSGELAGLEVDPQCYRKIEHWLDMARASDRERHLYRYNPYAPDTPSQRHGREASKTMTSVGLLMRLYSGWERDRAEMQRGADYLLENLPALGTPRDPQRDTYYWYYATQVMFHMGGRHWETWRGSLHPLLVDRQELTGPLAGSWDPRGPVPDRWAPHAGRLYVTTMNLLSLEVRYRHLPLYEETAK